MSEKARYGFVVVKYPQKVTADEALKAMLGLAKEKADMLCNAAGKETLKASTNVDTTVVAMQIKLLHDYDSQVREQATKALVELDREAVIPLITALHDEDDDVRKCAAWALGCIGDARALPALAHLERVEWGKGWGGWGTSGIARGASRKIRRQCQ